MKAILFRNLAILTIVFFAITQSGCQKSSSSNPLEIKLATSTTLGQYLVDKSGHAIYIFANDVKGRTSCTGGCSSLWPYFYVANLTQDKLGSGLNLSDFDTINVNGSGQLRYKSWPLYNYAPVSYNANVLEPAGQTNGDGFGNVWFVAKPDYMIMFGNEQLIGNDGNDYLGNYTQGIGKTLYFTDSRGVSLYTFSRDSLKLNKFTKSDLSNNGVWTMYETSIMAVPSTLDKTLFETISVFGRTQLTYKGWPLYYFGQDIQIRGNNKGISFPIPGIWPIAVKDLAVAP
jgi:predicted lipoprotein with Yx(FWY)xxD motif